MKVNYEFDKEIYSADFRMKMKQKMKKRQRRITDRNIKHDRMKKSKYLWEYMTIDKKPVFAPRKTITREDTKNLYTLKEIYIPPKTWLGETKGHTELIPVKTGEETVIKTFTSHGNRIGYKDVEPYVKEFSMRSRKYFKKYAAKKLRRSNLEDFSRKNCRYKKIFDIAWAVW